MKIVKYKVVGVLEDNYVKDDYWNEYKYLGFEIDNGDVVVMTISTYYNGDNVNGSDWEYRYLNNDYNLNDKFYKGHLWTTDEVDTEVITLIENCVEDYDLDSTDETDIEEIIYCD